MSTIPAALNDRGSFSPPLASHRAAVEERRALLEELAVKLRVSCEADAKRTRRDPSARW